MAWTLLIGVLALTLLQIAIAVRLNLWNRDFFNALESRDWNGFIYQMGIFRRCWRVPTMGICGLPGLCQAAAAAALAPLVDREAGRRLA